MDVTLNLMNSKLLCSYIARLLRKKQYKTNSSAQAQYNNITIYQSNKGFSLIELLIAITILGILASMVTYTMIGQQRKARDAQRKNDLTQVKNAMQSAKNDCKGSAYYPFGGLSEAGSLKVAFTSLVTDLKAAGYINATYEDPRNGVTYFYEYSPNFDSDDLYNKKPCSWATGGYTSLGGTSTFVFRAKLETGATDTDTTKSFNTCSTIISSSLAFTPAAATGDGYFYVCSS